MTSVNFLKNDLSVLNNSNIILMRIEQFEIESFFCRL